MADIAQLGIAVDTSQTKLAARELDNLAAAGAKAEGSAKKLGSTSKQAMEQAASATAKAQQTMERMLAAQERQERIMQQMSRQMDALTGAMQSNTAANNAAAKASENAAQAMGKQAAATQSAAQAMTEASQAMQGYASSTKAQAQASATATGGFTALTSSIGTLISAMAVRQVYEFGKAIFEASASAERLRTTLDFATGGKGASELAYVTQVANTLGLELQTTAKAYAQLAASARGTSLEGAGAKAIFESVSKASSVMGLTAEQTGGALNALQQMISKGSVQSEELRGQLGERLPGAFQIAARAMGVTTQELGKMLEQGLVPASEFLPRFAAQLDLEVGGSAEKAADRLDAAANRMSNAWNALKTAIGDSGVSQAIATEMKAISQDITVASETMQTLKSDGNGAFTQLAAAAAQLSGRAGFGLLNTASNALNGTINMLTGGVLGLRTDLAYVPDVMKTNAQQAAIMGDEVEAAKNKLARLQELDKNPANGNYYKTAIAQTQGLIASLNEAIGKKEQLARGGASADVYSPNSVQKQIQDSIDARQKERDSALEAFVTKRENMSKEQAMRKAIADAEKSHAEMMKKYDGDEAAQAKIRLSLESAIANVREKNKPAKEAVAVDAGENEVASIRARVKAVQANIAALQEYGAAAEKQTDGDRMVLKIQEELAGGIKGVARANKEKALAAAESLASAQKEEQAIKSQIELQKKQEEEYLKTIQAMSDVAEKTEQQAIGIEAQNEAYGRSKTAIEQQVLASKKLQLQRLEELGLTGDYTKALGLQIAAQERLVDALAASDYKKMSEHTDKLLSNANAQAALYADELELTGLTAVERAKVVAQRQVELKYAKEIDEVNRSNLSTDEKQAQLRKIAEAQQIESSAAVNKVIQDDFARTSEQINNSLTDALLNAFEGGKNAAQGVKDAIVKMFKDMVLRPVISAIVAPVSGMLSSGAQAMMGGVGGGGGGIFGSLAGSAAGTFFSGITTAVSAGFKGATLGVGMMGPTTAGAGGAMGFGNALAAIPGWGWALAGVAALAGLGIGKSPGEQHMGGIYSSSGKTDMDTAMRVTGGGGWDDGAWARDLTERADAAIGSSLEKVGPGLIDIFEQVNALAGGVADEFELTLGFAANLNGKGKDKNAFGYFDLTDKTTGAVITSYQNRELGTDTGAAMTKLTNDAARAMLDALAKADVPKWAQNALTALEATPGLQAMQEFLEYPKKLADAFGIAQESMAGAIAEGFKTGDGEAAGQALAQTVLSGIQNSIIGAASQQISTLVTNVILTPILDALANAQDPAAALADIDFDAVIAQAEGIGEGLATVLNNPALQAAMGKIDATLQRVGQSAVGAAGDLQLIAQSADAVAAAPAPAPVPVPTPAQASSGGGGGGAIGIPVGGFVDPNVYRIDLTDIAQQTADALDKIAESIKNLGKVTPQAYAAIDEQARQKFSELNGDYLAGLVEFGEQSRAKSIALGKIGEEIKAFYDASGAWSDISAGQAEELIEKLRKSSDLPAGLVDQLYAGYGSDYGAFFDNISLYVMDLQNAAWQVSEDMNGNKDELDSLNQQINQWSLAQKRLLATDELVSLATEAADATAKIEELKRTGGLTDPITQLKELYAKKMTDIDSGINAALQAEIDKKKGTAADYADYSVQLADFLKNGGAQFGTLQEYEDFVAKGKKILGDSFMGPMIGSENPWPEILQKMINELNTDVSAMTAEQQSYIKGLEDWYAVQKELLSTEMLVDINNQIKALEAEEKGPLTTIKEAIQKYADDFEELGTLTDEVQAQLDKLSGLQLDQARTSLYDQLLSEEERRAKEQEKLNSAFTELGATTPASTDALRAMIDAARDAGNVGLADSLLELVPAFVALQGAADGAGSALDRAMQDVDKAFAALQRSINAEKDRINADAQAQIDAINAGAEAREKAIDDARQQVQDIGGIFDDITKAVKTLRGNAQDEAMQMEQARAYISMALSVAQAGGTVDREKLREAMGTVTKDNAQSYVSGGDYRFAQARQAAELQALADVTGEQKDVAQATLDAALEANKAAQEQIDAIIEARDKQLKALEDHLKKAQEQIDVMKGVDISVLGVGDAVIAFDTAMATYQSEKSRVDAENLALQAAIDEKIKQQKEQDLEICIMQVDAINKMSSDIVSAIGSIPAPVQPPPSSSGPAITYDGDQGPGLYINGRLTGDVMPKFPSFDVGTNYVPRDTLAMVHEGEAIVPKAFNPSAFGGAKSDDGQLASLVVSLTTEVQRLQTIVETGNNEQRRTADAVNGRPEAPMLVETV